MERTRRRPIAAGRIPAQRALVIGLALVAAGSLALWAVAGGLAAAFALLGAAYYVIVYTMLLKPRTALSSVPGALAGVFPALIGWAATGAAWSPGILFLCALVFVWSPPHFWALALARGDDYRASGIPTPAIAYGEPACRRLIAAFVAAVTVLRAGRGRELRPPLRGDRRGCRRGAVVLHGTAARAARRPRRVGSVQGHGPVPRGRRRGGGRRPSARRI